MDDMAQKFVTALEELHSSKDAGPIAELFSDDATLSKAGMPHEQHGQDGAREFWQQYRDVFGDISATFRNTVTDDDLVILEWTSQGTLRDGKDFSYDGVSVLDCQDGAITGFRTYYDTAAFMAADERSAATSGQNA